MPASAYRLGTQYMRDYYQNNKARFAYYAAQYRDTLKSEMVEAYGGACQWCGESDMIVLTLDHINDDSALEKSAFGLNARGGHKLYARLKRAGWPKDRFQLLCHNCNARKEFIRRREEMENRWDKPQTSKLSAEELGI